MQVATSSVIGPVTCLTEKIESFVHRLLFKSLICLYEQTSYVLVFKLELFDNRI